ncbi:septal ring lytic transglycosylase RlpA family protein [Desulfotalea psychrophila]|uniref:Probable endolytic peptidoglycan transglycosylase RlpA n=1 Tax=Desulfotalea psychrophila (strain LSv54 / DSM 12343) TaxID=177439 RepID=Q6ALQ6_DESPS|nr:septal ring lytic transglycosylase RlpA family protein [Desulfotalea psychrophila]CAG36719.1 hypothetical protein DP1990 [Desulfotalea psychrophila LSv54]
MKKAIIFFLATILASLLPSPVFAKVKATQRPYIVKHVKYYPLPTSAGFSQWGVASWYGGKFQGRLTSNGERYDMFSMTAAHKTLPMQTVLVVTNLKNSRRVLVRVNDRGPFIRGRIIDLSYEASRRLGMSEDGIANVLIQAAQPDNHGNYPRPGIERENFSVQIAALANKEKALALEKRFSRGGHRTKIQKARRDGKTLYLVQIFAGYSRVKAKGFKKALLAAGYPDAAVVTQRGALSLRR